MIVGFKLGRNDADFADIAKGSQLRIGAANVVLRGLVEKLFAVLLDMFCVEAVKPVVAPWVADADGIVRDRRLGVAAIRVPILIAPTRPGSTVMGIPL